MNESSAAAEPALPAAYPADLARTWQAADGTTVALRALRPDDLDRELDFISGLSEETLRLRLQVAAKGVSREDAKRLLQLDYHDTLAIAAFVQNDAIVGVSRYSRLPGTDRAECAIVVADEWQGRGLGTELMRSLGKAACARGIRSLEGTSLAGNQRILDWARRFGFRVRTEPNSGGLLSITLDLESFPAA